MAPHRLFARRLLRIEFRPGRPAIWTKENPQAGWPAPLGRTTGLVRVPAVEVAEIGRPSRRVKQTGGVRQYGFRGWWDVAEGAVWPDCVVQLDDRTPTGTVLSASFITRGIPGLAGASLSTR